MEKKHVVGILVGEEPMCEEAKSMSCPYCVLYTSSNNTVVGVFSIPPERRWWLELLEKEPEVAGLRRAGVFFTDKVDVSSPWSLGKVVPDLDVAPCGAECGPCRWYQKECEGCPATKYYMPR